MGLKTAMRNLPNQWDEKQKVWVFGYGSLMWLPNFKFSSRKCGYIPGFVRRFWQGNTTHRGTPESPGRVATLIQEISGKAWGVAYELVGKEQVEGALHHLQYREVDLGGYMPYVMDFCDRDGKDCIPVIVFVAMPDNHLFLGDAPICQQAQQIVTSKGPSGYNTEYVVRIAQYVEEHIPEDKDEHLFDLYGHVKSMVEIEDVTKDSKRNVSRDSVTVRSSL